MKQRRRRVLGVLLIAIAIAIMNLTSVRPEPASPTSAPPPEPAAPASTAEPPTPTGHAEPLALASTVLETLPVKGRAPKTDYRRVQFGDGWILVGNCDTRNTILNRDLTDVTLTGCKVATGKLTDPYTGKQIDFQRGPSSSTLIQIDHVVALSNAWQTGAQLLTLEQRIAFANDPLELLAVDGDANQAKGDGDAATWLPANKAFRCQYVARQIAVKAKYQLWVTQAEKDAMQRVLGECPEQRVPGVK